ncbi:purine and uridine phosphorylase [Viridothelium virens]|uniref:Purine and uridine phosphorylase n=1 Tax=Viridothelium virens TaxID=1048519 RepID=A0A6A6H3J9_VIRVR|nr:purine and uridine phosphorylase [Viridothelium virens]
MSRRPHEHEQELKYSTKVSRVIDEGEKVSGGLRAQALSNDDFTVGWICALEIEELAAVELLDEEFDNFSPSMDKSDWNKYRCGRIGEHKLVIASHPEAGTIQAAQCAAHMCHTFSQIRIGLMVGIGGGIPSEGCDIRLGDVVVSKPTGVYPGVVQYDFGKQYEDSFLRIGSLNRPPTCLLAAAKSLVIEHMRGKGKLAKILDQLLNKNDIMKQKFSIPEPGTDTLYADAFSHVGSHGTDCTQCEISPTKRIAQRKGKRQYPIVHRGIIASGNKVIKDTGTRERIRREFDALCFEMEAAGLMNEFPCIVIRGISDYADSHKNDYWQPYAAATAAAYAKELLLTLNAQKVAEEPRARDLLNKMNETKTNSGLQELIEDRQHSQGTISSLDVLLEQAHGCSSQEHSENGSNPQTELFTVQACLELERLCLHRLWLIV